MVKNFILIVSFLSLLLPGFASARLSVVPSVKFGKAEDMKFNRIQKNVDVDYEKWLDVGQGYYQDPFYSINESDIPGLWSVTFYRNRSNSDQFMLKPYMCADSWQYGLEIDSEIILNITNRNKIYVENMFDVGSDWLALQKVEENGYTLSSIYGSIEDNTVSIPIEAFVATMKNNPGKDWYDFEDKVRGRIMQFIFPDEVIIENNKPSGIYMGIKGFNDNVKSFPISLLNKNTKSDFTRFINRLTTSEMGTVLLHTVNSAIDELASTKLPKDLGSVVLITFTDGLDVGSMEFHKGEYDDNAEIFEEELSKKIKNIEIQGLPLQAYCIGVEGDDLSIPEQFTDELKNLSSSDDNARLAADITQIQTHLDGIADNLIKTSVKRNLKITRPIFSNGEVVRYVLDKMQPEESTMYIEGVFSSTDNSLHDLKYVGFKTASGDIVGSTVKDGKYSYVFVDCRTMDDNLLEISPLDIREYSFISKYGKWKLNSEFGGENAAKTEDILTSTAIMFCIDCSKSLGSEDFITLKKVARSFIDTLLGEEKEEPEKPDTVDSINDESEMPVEYYNLNGMRVMELVPGIYIRRQGSNVSKIVVSTLNLLR